MPQRPMSVNPSGTVLSLHLRSSSVSSSLASPGDSGVAFDSDMDIANETDGSSYKEVRCRLSQNCAEKSPHPSNNTLEYEF